MGEECDYVYTIRLLIQISVAGIGSVSDIWLKSSCVPSVFTRADFAHFTTSFTFLVDY